MRGSLALTTGGGIEDGSIPARAGKPVTILAFCFLQRVYPRPCGEALASSLYSSSIARLSPPVRGSQLTETEASREKRSIPARAGKPSAATSTTRRRRVYPRPCGEATKVVTLPDSTAGLSPPVRGSHPSRRWPRRRARSIPARAGKPRPGVQESGRAEVYPRPCGEAYRARNRRARNRGLSPPVRGSRCEEDRDVRITGSIPARAGKPRDRSVSRCS